MTTTLRDLIENRSFEGYVTEPLGNQLSPHDLERALYGEVKEAVYYKFLKALCAIHEVDLVIIVPSNQTGASVGLEILRLDTRPVALIQRPPQKSTPTINLIDADSFHLLRAAWEASKSAPAYGKTMAPENLLDMPVAAPGLEPFATEDQDPSLRLSTEGIETWITVSGGLSAVTSIPALNHALTVLLQKVAETEDTCRSIRRQYLGRDMPPPMARALSEFDDYLAKLKTDEEAIVERILELA